MQQTFRAFTLCFLSGFSSLAVADTFTPLDAFVEEIQAKHSVPGIAVGIVKDGKLIYAKGFGFRDKEQGLRVTPRTLFGIGSNTKAFTALSAGLLVDSQKLEWDSPVQKILPNFQLTDAVATANATLRDLLLHRTGQARHDLMWLGSEFKRSEIFRRIGFLEANLAFREKFQYSNLMYMGAGHLVETAAKTSWESLIKNQIFSPLEMNASNTSTLTSQQTDDFSVPYTESSSQIIRRPFRVLDNMGPAGSINSSIEDLAKWLMFQLSAKTPTQHSIVTEETFQELHRPQIAVPDSAYNQFAEFTSTEYALGWRIQKYRGTRLIRHGGSIGGFLSTIATLPDLNAGVVVLQNVDHFDAESYIALRAYDLLLGMTPIDWVARLEPQPLTSLKDPLSAFALLEDEAAPILRVSTTPVVEPSEPPPQPEPESLANYVGVFEEQGYGALRVSLEKGTLYLTYNDWKVALTKKAADHFSCEGPYTGDVIFTTLNNQVSSAQLNLEPTVRPILFYKKPPRKRPKS